MPKKGKNGTVIEELNHAFELTLIIITIVSGIVSQLISIEQQIGVPPIIANVQRFSIIFIFPTVLTILVWILTYFFDDETQKMHLRVYAWSSIIFLSILAL
jgi:hypothetical protein